MGIAPPPKAEDYIKDGKFLQEEYNAAWNEWDVGFVEAYDAYQKQKDQEFLDSIAEYTESVGGDNLTAEEFKQQIEEDREFSKKVAEIMQSYAK